MTTTELVRLASAVPFAMLIVDYSAILERYRGLDADQVADKLECDAELAVCLELVDDVAATDGWIRLYGKPDAGRRSQTITNRLPDPIEYPTLRASLVTQFSAPFRGDTSLAFEHRVPGGDGGDRIVRSQWNATVSDDGTPDYTRIVISDLDVTDLRVAESSLAASDRLESMGRLAAGIAHEINTPIQYIGDNTLFLQKAFERLVLLAEEVTGLADIQARELDARVADLAGMVDSLKLPFLTSRVPRAIQQSLDGVASVTHIVRAMRNYSHPGSEHLEMVDLNEAIETTLTVSRSVWKYIADVTFDPDPDLGPIAAMPGEINQVILNLVVNSAHAIEAHADGAMGSITISTRADGSDAVITISDSGGGIPAEILDRIFDPFFTTKGVGKGTGQGLAISRSIVEEHHNGSIRVQSRPGDGTTFEIRLPRRATEQETSA